MITREQVLLVLQRQGPSLPLQIKKTIGEGDSFIIGAILTELREAGKIKVSHVKRGGSPFYYVPEHAEKLVNFISDLGEKERRTAELLQEKGILEDATQMPLVRVTLREIKDYAVAVRVKINEEEKLFWKWYLLPHDQIEGKIKAILGIVDPVPKAVEPKLENVVEELKGTPTQASEPKTEDHVQKITPLQKKKENEEIQEELALEKNVSEKEKLPDNDEFAQELAKYFAEKNIAVLSAQILRKNSDIELNINVPTPFGQVQYFCKAKNKKKNNEGDLSSAYVQGQVKKLPAIYLTTGEVTKKAREKLEKEFKGLLLVEL